MQTKKILLIIGGMIALVVLGVAVAFGYRYLEDERAGLAGTAREAFLPAARDHCRRQTLPGPTQAALCECYAVTLADTLSNNDVKAIGTLDPTVSMPMQPKLDAAAKICEDRFRNTGHF